MLYVYCALLAAYLPTWIVLLIRIIDGKTTKMLQHASELALVIVLINSTVNPTVIYYSLLIDLLTTNKAQIQDQPQTTVDLGGCYLPAGRAP